MPRSVALVLTLLALSPWGNSAAQAFGTVTILEGDALVLRGPGRVHAIEGLRLVAADIVEMGDKGFAQIELGDKTRLLLGPNARVLVNASAPKQKPELTAYALGGWFKLIGTSREPQSNTPALEFRSPRFALPTTRADIVVRMTAEQIDVFAESGAAQLLERAAPAAAQPIEIKPGQHYFRKGNEKASVRAGAQPALVAEMPRAFRDSLPARIVQFAGKDIVAKTAPDFTYEDVADWLKGDPNVRRPLVARWRHKSREPAFRNALIANMAAHMEWDRIVFPEKYLPKPSSPPPLAPRFDRTAPDPTNPSNQYR